MAARKGLGKTRSGRGGPSRIFDRFGNHGCCRVLGGENEKGTVAKATVPVLLDPSFLRTERVP